MQPNHYDPTCPAPAPRFYFSLISPNAQWGCVTIKIFALEIFAGFVPGLFGLDVYWRNRTLISTN